MGSQLSSMDDMGSNVNICLACGIVGNASAKFCSACGRELTGFSSSADVETQYGGLVEDDTSAEWLGLFDGLNNSILVNLKLLKEQLVEIEPGSPQSAGSQKVVFIEIEDDPWGVSIPMPNGEVAEPWAACYFRQWVPSDVFEGKFFAFAANSALGSELPERIISYAVISCPRCEWQFNQTEAAIEGDEEFDRELAESDCLACNGSGEWVLGD